MRACVVCSVHQRGKVPAWKGIAVLLGWGGRTQSVLVDASLPRELCERGGAVDGHEAGYVELSDDAEAGGIVDLDTPFRSPDAAHGSGQLITHGKSHKTQGLVRTQGEGFELPRCFCQL